MWSFESVLLLQQIRFTFQSKSCTPAICRINCSKRQGGKKKNSTECQHYNLIITLICRLSGTYLQQPVSLVWEAAGRFGPSRTVGVTGGRHPEAHTALRGKTWCSGTCWCPDHHKWAISPREGEAKERVEKKKKVDGKKRTPCCFSLMWRQTEKLEHGMRFYIHLANIVWNSDWHYSNFSTWNPSGALHPVFVQQNHKELLRGCKMSKDRYRGLNSTVETSLENRYFCKHISNDSA